MIKKIITIFILLCFLVLFGCAGRSNFANTTPEDQAIIDAGTEKAKILNLKPVPIYGDYGRGSTLIIDPAKYTNEDLLINATQNVIILKGMTVIQRGQYARRIDNAWKIVE
jgi:hypothetical protein